MEPMTLGSPGTSPVYSGHPGAGVGGAGGFPAQSMPGAGFAPGAVSSPFQQPGSTHFGGVQHPGGGGAYYGVGTPNQQGHHVSFSTPTGVPGHQHPGHAMMGAGAAQGATPGNAAAGGFLPGYLMGDYSQQGSGRLVSPTRLNRSVSQQGGHQLQRTASTPQTPGGGAMPSQAGVSTPSRGGFLTPTAGPLRTPSDKPSAGGGPPTTGLFSAPRAVNGGTPKYGTPGSRLNSTPMPSTPQLSFGGTPVGANASLREEIFNASTAASSDLNTWITVFGFPPSASSYILSQFSQYGTILQHHIPANGNWMHLRYQTKMQAQKALGKSGRVLGGSIMIGVSPCTDPSVTEEAHSVADSSVLNRSHLLHNQSVAAGVAAGDTSVTTLNSSLGGARLNSSIRPLTQAYKAAASGNEIAGRNSTPNKNGGIVGKAMEYIFGW